MRLLVDTHVWLWMLASPERIGERALGLFEDPRNEILLSAACTWEIAIKYERGRLALPEPPAEYVPSRMRRSGVVGLAVEHVHAAQVASLPPHHRDPFDRLLVGQARVEGLPIVTVDPAFEPYDVEVIPGGPR